MGVVGRAVRRVYAMADFGFTATRPTPLGFGRKKKKKSLSARARHAMAGVTSKVAAYISTLSGAKEEKEKEKEKEHAKGRRVVGAHVETVHVRPSMTQHATSARQPTLRQPGASHHRRTTRPDVLPSPGSSALTPGRRGTGGAVMWGPSKPKPAPRRLPNGNLPPPPHEQARRVKSTDKALEAAAARRKQRAQQKHAKFKPKAYGTIAEQCARIRRPTDNPLLVLEKHRLYYSALRDLRACFDAVDESGDGLLQAEELEHMFSSVDGMGGLAFGSTASGGARPAGSPRSPGGVGKGGGVDVAGAKSPSQGGSTRGWAGDGGKKLSASTPLSPPGHLGGGSAGAVYGQIFRRRGKREMTFKDVLGVMYPGATRAELDELDAVMRPKTPEVTVEVDEAKMKDVTDLFNLMDEDGSGELDLMEFREVLRQMGIEDVEEQDAFFYEIDEDGGGTVSLEEFQEWWFGIGGAGEVDGD